MTDALRTPQREEPTPFAADAGREYLESEAHYRPLAATVLELLLQQRHRNVLVTGTPAPNGELLARQMARDGAPRCRAIAVKGSAQMTCEALLNSYRKLLGIAVAEETLKRAAGVAQPIPFPRGHEIEILVLDNAESLSNTLLENLCRPLATTEEEHRPVVVLLGKDAILERLQGEELGVVDHAIEARLALQQLAPAETAPFIESQMKAAHLEHLDIFKAPILELIGIFADGNPSAVNELARRVLTITQRPRAEAPQPEAPQPETPSGEDESAPPDEGVAHINREPAAVQDEIRTVEPQIIAAPPDAMGEAEETTAETEETIAEVEETAEAVALADEPAAAATSLTADVPPAIAEASPPQEVPPAPLAASAEENPASQDEAAEAVALSREQKPPTGWTVELPPSFDAIEASPFAETASAAPLDDYAAGLEESATESADADHASSDEMIDETVVPFDAEGPGAPVAASGEPIADEPDTAAEEVAASAADDIAPLDAADEIAPPSDADDLTPARDEDDFVPRRDVEYPRPHLREDAAAVIVADAESEAAPRPPRSSRRIAALCVIAVLAVIALVLGFDIGHLRRADSLQLDARMTAAVNFIATLRDRIEASLPSPATNSVSVPVAKEPSSQPLRTTTENSDTDLLLHPDASTPSSKPSAATPDSAATAPAAPSVPPPAPPAPAAAPSDGKAAVAVSPPEPAPSVATPPAPAPALVPAPSPPPAAKTAPAKRETAAAPIVLTPPRAAPEAAVGESDNDQLLRRGDQLLNSGDIIAARQYFQRVIEAGDQRAALRLGKTYDPAFLKQIGARGIAGDPTTAKSWYLKAIAAGDKDADMRLLQLMALYPE